MRCQPQGVIAQRIVQLGGAPNFSPEGLMTRSHSEYIEGAMEEEHADDLVSLLEKLGS
jgi:bacterioferritin